MLSLLLAVQTPVGVRPSGPGYIFAMAFAAIVGAILVAAIAAQFDRPAKAAEKVDAPQVRSRGSVPQTPPQVKPEGVRR
jgi:hypothetical protein